MSRNRRRSRQSFRRLRLEPLEPRLALDASMLRITELVASNDNGLADADGDSSDWLEIYNSGAELVNLGGMRLTDNPNNLSKWTFPAGTSLEAGAYLVVFASNKNGVLAGGELHTNFALSADGEFLALVDTTGVIIDQYNPSFPAQLEDIGYGRAMQLTGASSTLVTSGAGASALVPTSGALGTSWTNPDFDDSTWPIAGPTGLGYENNPGDAVNFTSEIQTAVPSGISSAYIRVEFNLTSLADIGRLALRMKYDDGFVAYINGVEIAEANAPEVLSWDSPASATHDDSAALTFIEFDVSSAIRHLRIGQNVLAIHALNQPTGSDMLIVPELVAQAMSIVAPEDFGYFDVPTPGYGNGESFAGFVNGPTFSVPHGYYNSTQSVSLATTTPGAIIVYTTNGSTPAVNANLVPTNGTLYSGPITVSGTTTLRAMAFLAEYKPSFVSASTYLFVSDIVNQSPFGQVPPGWPPSGVNGQTINYGIDPDIINLYGIEAVKNSLASLPAISITTDLANLFNPSTGIYVNATNRGDSWERPATVELINPNGDPGFEVNAGLRIRGGYSRNDQYRKHGFRVYFRSEYGDSKLNYDLFGGEGVSEFDVLDLRADQNYSWASEGNVQNTLVREVFSRDTQRDLGEPYTRSRYYQLYIDGVYWGIYQTQERIQEFYGESYFGGDESDYDVVKADLGVTGATEIADGNDLAWRKLFDYGQALATSPATNANVYWTMQGLNPDGTRNPALPVLLDVDNLIDYMSIIFYTGGYDTGLSRFLGDNYANNWFGMYNRVTADRGFQFFIHDNEHSLGAEGGTTHGTLNIDRTGPFNNGNQSIYAQFNPQYLHQDLLASPEYKQLFVDHVQKNFFNGGALTVQATIDRFMARKNQVDPAIIAESARWGDSVTATPLNKSTWQNEINWIINTYFPQRGNTVLNQLRNDGLFTFAAPTFSRFGGDVPNNYPLTFTAGAGTIYYTTDGITDPRAIGGAINTSPAVTAYTGQVPISGTTTVMARLRAANGQWSGLVEATFDTFPVPGDYNGSGTVDQLDYNTWFGNFGSTTALAADGNGNGTVDAADYTIWRDHLGLTVPFGAGAGSDTSGLKASFASDLGTAELPALAKPETRVVAANTFAMPLPSQLDVATSFLPQNRKSVEPTTQASNLLLARRLEQVEKSSATSDDRNSFHDSIVDGFDESTTFDESKTLDDELLALLATNLISL